MNAKSDVVDTKIFHSFEALHVYSDDHGRVIIRQGDDEIVFPSQLAPDVAHFVIEAGRGDR